MLFMSLSAYAIYAIIGVIATDAITKVQTLVQGKIITEKQNMTS